MITPADFGRLRLKEFLPVAELHQLADWHFMEDVWLGEALGFTEFLRLEREPEVLLGNPHRQLTFVEDRTSYEFRTDGPRYDISCTVRHDGGLSYLVIMASEPGS